MSVKLCVHLCSKPVPPGSGCYYYYSKLNLLVDRWYKNCWFHSSHSQIYVYICTAGIMTSDMIVEVEQKSMGSLYRRNQLTPTNYSPILFRWAPGAPNCYRYYSPWWRHYEPLHAVRHSVRLANLLGHIYLSPCDHIYMLSYT